MSPTPFSFIQYTKCGSARPDPGVPFIYNVRFPGQYYDSETGLHYNYFRYYDPSTGRYITSDPIGLDGGLNTYGYVGGNPVGLVDLYGLEPYAGFGNDVSDLVNEANANYNGDTNTSSCDAKKCRSLEDVFQGKLSSNGDKIVWRSYWSGLGYTEEEMIGIAKLDAEIISSLGGAGLVKACLKNKAVLKKACNNAVLAAALGTATCQGKSLRRMVQDRQRLDDIRDAPQIQVPRRNTGSQYDK